MYKWLVFLHVVSAFVFFMAHGASAVMAFRLKRETDAERMRAILDLSAFAIPVMYWALMLLVLAGIGAGIMGHWFSMGWIWAALGILVLVWMGMTVYAGRYYTPLRKALGLEYHDRHGEHPAEAPASGAVIRAKAAATNPMLLGGITVGLIGVIVYLMLFKPF